MYPNYQKKPFKAIGFYQFSTGWKLLICIFSLHLFSYSNVFSQDSIAPLIIKSEIDEYDLTDYISILKDPNYLYDINEIVNDSLQSRFTLFDPQEVLDPKSVYWTKFRVINENGGSNLPNQMKIFIGHCDFFELYQVEDSTNNIIKKKGGMLLPASEQELDYGIKIQGANESTSRVNIDFKASTGYTVYVKLWRVNHHNLKVSISLNKMDFYQSWNFIKKLKADWFILGIILTIFLLNLLYFITTKDKVYLYHSIFIIGIFLFLLSYHGVFHESILFKNKPHLIPILEYAIVITMIIAYYQFIRYYFMLKKNDNYWNKVFKRAIDVMKACFVIIVIAYYFTSNEPVIDKTFSVFMAFNFLLVSYYLLYKNKERKLHNLLIIAGSIFIFLAALMNSISFLLGEGLKAITLELGFALEVLLFSLALGFRIKELQRQREEGIKLKEMDSFKTKLYNNITHEFRTPLTVILGLTDLSPKYISNYEKKNLKNAFSSINRNSKGLLRLVNQMLDLSKIETNSMKINWVQQDLISLIKQILENVKGIAEPKNIDLNLRTKLSEYNMDLDPEKYDSIFNNLLSNAIKFTPEDGEIIISINESIKEGNKWIDINVRDTGYGIDKEHLDHIFDRFYKVEAGPSKKTVGTGIGLSLTKELVELMGGTISSMSQLGLGSTFSVSMPVSNDASSISIEPQKDALPKREDPGMLVQDLAKTNADLPLLLIIDDNADIRNYLVNLLDENYIIELAENGDEGVEKALKLIPDLIISDVMMPIKDGFQLCEELKENEKTNHIPIVLLTAKAGHQDKIKGLKLGADAYLQKPFEKDELFVRLDKLNELRKNLYQKYSQFALIDDPESMKKQNSFIHQVNTIIEENITDENFSVESLAQMVYMSRMQLHRKLKALSNRSASNYIRSYKLHKSKSMLMDAELSISDVAFDLGFRDPNYFSKSFQKEFGITPTEFRSK